MASACKTAVPKDLVI